MRIKRDTERETKREWDGKREREKEIKNQEELDRAHQRNLENSKLMRQILVVEYFLSNIFIYATDFWCMKFCFDN